MQELPPRLRRHTAGQACFVQHIEFRRVYDAWPAHVLAEDRLGSFPKPLFGQPAIVLCNQDRYPVLCPAKVPHPGGQLRDGLRELLDPAGEAIHTCFVACLRLRQLAQRTEQLVPLRPKQGIPEPGAPFRVLVQQPHEVLEVLYRKCHAHSLAPTPPSR